jgi:radical SAM superfamily enzyme YgiQ (UPF0313 family)
MYLSTILELEGHKVEFTDFRDGPKKPNKADAYLYTVASPDFKEVAGIVNELRKESDVPHIAGGPHINIFPTESLKVFDSIAIGQADKSILQMANDLNDKKLQGTYFQKRSENKHMFPRRHFLPKEKIVTSLFKTEDIPSTTVLFSHGCPFSCSFCANYDRGSIVNRDLESISIEMDYLKTNYQIKGLSLQDENCIPYKPQHALDFLYYVRKANLKWRGQLRADVNKALLPKIRESGCLELSVGLESVDQDTLDYTNKQIKVKTVKETIKACHEHDIKIRLYLLNGLPGEPKDIVEKTKRFIDENKPDVVLLSTLQPYPGSDIYNNPEKYGIKWIDKDFTKYNHLRCRFADSKDKMEEAVPFEYETGFSRQQIMDNLVNLQSYLRDKGLNK